MIKNQYSEHRLKEGLLEDVLKIGYLCISYDLHHGPQKRRRNNAWNRFIIMKLFEEEFEHIIWSSENTGEDLSLLAPSYQMRYRHNLKIMFYSDLCYICDDLDNDGYEIHKATYWELEGDRKNGGFNSKLLNQSIPSRKELAINGRDLHIELVEHLQSAYQELQR